MKIKGFTLIEILVALAVIGIGMSAALSVTNQVINTMSEVEKRTYGNWVAENILSELKLKGETVPGKINGDSEMAGRTWYWAADVIPTFDEDVLQCEITVSLEKDFTDVQANYISYLIAAEIDES